MKLLKTTLAALVFILISFSAFSQVTTATITGKVSDETGTPLIGANVVAVHVPSGSQYGTITREDGRYTLPNLRIGGPYFVEVSYVGNETQKQEGISLQIGQKLKLNFSLKTESLELESVTVIANADPTFNSDNTGASTNIGKDIIQKLPSISRSTQDYYRLTPSSDGSSFGGRNNKMNNFTLDGSIFNNPFGLDAATPGSQSGAQPISLDAIDQVQVDIAPYDVKMAGFTGASVNAVTKSGTNHFKGTVFGFYRNQNLTGKKVDGESIFVPDLTHLQTGFSIGGPIIKDKLFFFANAEIERRGDLGSNYLAARPGLEGENVSRVTAADLEAVSNVLKERYGYETGAYENYIHRTDNQKGIFKLDWHINNNHSLTATYNFLDATRGKPAHPEAIGRRGPDQTTLQFENSGYEIRNLLHSGIIEFKSLFGNKFANNLQAGITAFRDSRNPFSEPFPTINIAKDGIRYIVAGHEPFSIHNRLNQDVLQLTDNFDMYLGNHTITVGLSFEKFSFDNSFNLGTYPGVFGNWQFGYGDFPDVATFVEVVESGAFDESVNAAKAAYEANGGDDGELGKGWALAETNVGQVAFYAQDEWAATEDFTLTVGLRVDKPLYFDTAEKAQENIDRNCCYDPTRVYYDVDGNEVKFDQTELPTNKPLFSPRFGFNWDAKGDNTLQVRGGSGLFTGRFPFVWVGNQIANPNTYFYCVTDPDLQWPQVWRSNIGIDTKLPNDITLTADLIYTKDIHSMMVRNAALKAPSGTLQGVDDRPYYVDTLDRNPAALGAFGYENAYVFTNADIGSSFNFSLQLKKMWGKGYFTSIAYDYLDSKDASSIPAEISSDAYARNPAYGNVNKPVLSHSRYGHKHRVVGSAYKKFTYSQGKAATSIAVFFEYVKGGRFSYTYSGDINRDGSGLNDLIYIPTDSEVDQMNFTGEADEQAAQKAALKAFIAQDDYLSANRGAVAGKYDILSPLYSDWDVRILQDFNFSVGSHTNTIQLSMDILNFGNLLNSKWGVRQNPTNTQPIGVSTDANGNPTYSFDTSLKSTFTNDFSLLSRWQIQFGARYIF